MISVPSVSESDSIVVPAVQLQDVTLHYPDGVRALDGVTLRVDHGERVAIVGSSGAGKSSLLSLLNGRALFDGALVGGRVEVLGLDPLQLSPRARRRHSAQIGTVRQALDLVGPMQVAHNINAGQLGRWSTARSLWSLVGRTDVERLTEALRTVGLEPSHLTSRVEHLSGGQQQRVAIARLLVQRPLLALADEPVSSLDPTLSKLVIDLLAQPPAGHHWTLLANVHQPELARLFADRIIGLRHGRIVFDELAATIDDDQLAAIYQR